MKHPRILFSSIPICAILISALSCGLVLEDRSDCPCILTVVIPERDSPVPLEALVFNVGDEDLAPIQERTLSAMALSPGGSFQMGVPRRILSDLSIAGLRNYVRAEDHRSLFLPEGCESDSLFIHTSMVDCRGERATDTLLLHKQWCTLYIRLVGATPGSHYHFRLDGRWGGTDVYSLGALEGNFNCEARTLREDLYSARIPRQGDNSLRLSMIEELLDGSYQTRILDYPLGTTISEGGFDWSERDLGDVELVLDFATSDFHARVVPWYGGNSLGDIDI